MLHAGAAVHAHDNDVSSVSSSGSHWCGQHRGRHHKSKVSCAHVLAYNAQAAVHSALATWVHVAHVHIAASMVYDEQHAEASAAVLPIIDDIRVIQRAEHVSFMTQGNDPQHWYYTHPVQPLGWGSSQTGDFMHRNWGIYITGILAQLSS